MLFVLFFHIFVPLEKKGKFSLDRTYNNNVTIDGDCGSGSTDAKLVLIWPKNDSFYNLTMVFSEVTKGLEAKSNPKWRVKKIIINVTLAGNPEFENATGKVLSN